MWLRLEFLGLIMPQVTFLPGNKICEALDGESILEVAVNHDVMMQQQLQQAIARQQYEMAVAKAQKAQAKYEVRLANAQKRRAEADYKLEIDRARRSTALAKQ